ncbi:Peroxisomal membrane protein PMP27 [Ceratobasidium sp. 392]|nr:Peroxisomal membrane protein PMP27 [Ceratobasidium sp. 392]
MADIASQLVFHPVVSQSIKVLATTLGRDKLYRTVQYFARFLAWILLTRGYKLEAARWNSLKAALASGRKSAKVNKASQRFWLSGILFSIVHGLVKVARLANEAKRLRSISEKGVGADADRLSRAEALDIDRINTRWQLIQDSLDFFLPASNLGLVGVNDGVAGIIGVITSVMALQLQWKAVGKTMGK